MYFEYHLNLQHKSNKNDFKQMFQWEIACTTVAARNTHEGNMQDGCRKGRQVQCASGMPQDISRRWENTRKGWAVGVGYYLGAWIAITLI
jgi:hypothetical protein